MDTGSEVAKFKWLLIVGVMFLISCYICYGEMVYLFRAEEIEATVTKTYEVQRGRFGRSTRLVVEYAFYEPNGAYRTDDDTVSTDWEMPASGKVAVEYTPGKEGRSRLSGHRNWFGIIFFVASLLLLGFFGVRLWSQAGEATQERKPRRKK